MKGDGKALSLRRKGGGSVVEHRPVFSADEQRLYLLWGSWLRCYSVATGDLVGEYQGLAGRAVGLRLKPSDPEVVVACTRCGDLYEWTVRDLQQRQPHKVSLDLKPGRCIVGFHLMVDPEGHSDQDVAVLLVSTSGHSKVQVEVHPTCQGRGDGQEHRVRKCGEMVLQAREHSYSFGGNALSTFVATVNREHLNVLPVYGRHGVELSFALRHEMTCVACHPVQRCVLTGDVTGAITLWQGLFHNPIPVCSVYHWHTLPVEDVAFSQAGSYFYSVGSECVLVKWTFNAPNQKQFLPRLPAHLRHVVVSLENSFLAVSTLDNAVQLVNSHMELAALIQHFSWNPQVRPSGTPVFPAGLVVDPRSGALVLNGRTGHVQFFSCKHKSLMYQLSVTGQNYLTQERHKVPINTDVVRIGFSADGQWMATVEHRNDLVSSCELRLKFWWYDDQKQSYRLNTSIEQPHRSYVHCLRFRPSGASYQRHLAVTTGGDDLKFRTWTLASSDSCYSKGEVWCTESIGFYKNFPAEAAAFSEDGSLLAVTFEEMLTLWVPGTNELKCSLTRTDCGDHLTHVEFGRKECVHLVVTASHRGVAVWNLLSLSLLWTVSLPVSLLISDCHSSLMAVLSTSNDVVLFAPASHQPLHKQNAICDKDVDILAAVFVKGQLYTLDSKRELCALEDPDQECDGLALNVLPSDSRQPATAFSAMIAKNHASDVHSVGASRFEHLGVVGMKDIKQLLAAPAHTSAPISLLCGSLLLSLVTSSQPVEECVKDEDNAMDWKSDSGIVSSDDEDTAATAQPGFEQCKHQMVTRLQRISNGTLHREALEEQLLLLLEEPTNWVSTLANRPK